MADRARTESSSSIAEENGWIDLHAGVVQNLGQLQQKERHREECEAARRNVVERRYRVQFCAPALQQDLDQDQPSRFGPNGEQLQDDSHEYKVQLPCMRPRHC